MVSILFIQRGKYLSLNKYTGKEGIMTLCASVFNVNKDHSLKYEGSHNMFFVLKP